MIFASETGIEAFLASTSEIFQTWENYDAVKESIKLRLSRELQNSIISEMEADERWSRLDPKSSKDNLKLPNKDKHLLYFFAPDWTLLKSVY